MTTTKARARRSRRGFMSGIKHSARGGRPTPLWQWIVSIPIVGLLLAAIVLFAYVRYFNPSLGAPVRTVRTTVERHVMHVVSSNPGLGGPDPSGSYLLVHIEGREVHLAGNPAEWKETADGDTVEVELADPGDGSLQARSWKRVAPAPPG